MGLDEAVKALISQGGLLGALLVISMACNGWLYREMRKGEKTHKTEVDEFHRNEREIFKERVTESNTLVLALNQSAQANIALERSSTERTAAVRDLTNGFAQLVAILGVRDERVADFLRAFEQRMQEIDRVVRGAIK